MNTGLISDRRYRVPFSKIPVPQKMKKVSYGGSAAGGGFDYQASVCAYVCVHMLRQMPLNWLAMPDGDLPAVVSAETSGPGDDLRIQFADGTVAEVQVKRGLRADDRLFEAVDSILDGLEADASLRAILVVDTRSSGTIRDELRTDLQRIAQGRRDDLHDLANRILRRMEASGLHSSILERFSIEVLPSDEPASPHRKLAIRLLADLVGDERATDVWNALVRDCLAMITLRGRRDRVALLTFLGIRPATAIDRTDGFDSGSVLDIARRARDRDLRPWILERVARPFVRTGYVPLIQTLRTEELQALAIVGDAGYGKTTMLGEIYDHLMGEGMGWVGVLLCADVVLNDRATVDELAVQIGKVVSGFELTIAEVCARMNDERGEGILLIDTLDLVLGGSFDRNVGTILGDVAETGTVVVLTCREYEFAQFASPDPTRARAPINFVLRDAPPFSEREVRAATETYVELHGGSELESGPEFAERLLNLSTGNHRLEQIVRNPLLLALLCELFATEGYVVPPDLTVSKLYDTYWDLRVTRSRKYPDTSVELRKPELCREIAALLLQGSHDHIKTRIRRDDIPVRSTELDRDALDELLSDGVLRVGAAGRVEFFHQTFLEYAIARWLNLAANAPERRGFFRATLSESGPALLHVWPVVRQVLTTSDPEDFEALVSELDLQDPMAFKAVALAAVAAEQIRTLEQLAVIARDRGPGYRDALLFAVGSAPRSVVPTTWRVVLSLMDGEPFGVAMQVSKPLGSLLAQTSEPLATCVEEAISKFLLLDAEDADEQALPVALGTLMRHFAGPLMRRADLQTLAVLREHYGVLRSEAQELVITLHVQRGDAGARAKLLQRLQAGELLPGSINPLIELARAVVADQTPASQTALAALRRLDAQLPKGWYLVQARLAGWDAAEDKTRLKELIQHLLSGDPRLLDKVLLALRIAVEAGAGQEIVGILTSGTVSEFPGNRRNALSRLLRDSAAALGADGRKGVADWLLAAGTIPGELLTALTFVADEEPARDAACKGISELRSLRRYQVVAQVLDQVPEDFGKALVAAATQRPAERGSEAEAESMWVVWERRLARAGYEASIAELVRLSVRGRKQASLQAADALATLAAERPLPVQALLPLAKSALPGVRRSLITASLALLESGRALEEGVLDDIVAAYARETNTAVLQPLFSLVGKWIEVHERVPRQSGEAVAMLPERLRAVGGFDRGMARGVAHVLKVMAQRGDPAFLPRVSAWALDYFASLDARLMNASQASMSELLVRLAQADSRFLERALQRAPSMPPRSIRVLAKTIMRTLGPSSPLLDRLATAPWCPPEVRQVVLGFRGT